MRRAFSGVQLTGAAAVITLVLCGCGTSGHASGKHGVQAGTSHALCQPAALAAIARQLHVSRSRIATTKQLASNGMPQCTFSDGHGAHATASVVVNVDDGPQVEFRMDRTVEEASQIFGAPPPGWRAPIGLRGLGPYASWFQARDALMATNGTDLLTVTVNWPRARQAAMIALARDAIEPYMKLGHPPGPKAVIGFPSG
ncbi:MAG: hypothetical protein ACRDKL_01015 [Solirubrobacteraceae bacterium]